jgi:hypothetical protein
MFDLSSISRSISKPPRIVVYGVPGVGKTTLASQAPDCVFLPVEDGCGELGVQSFPRPTEYAQVVEAINTLLEGGHQFRTLVVDSLDKLEPLVWDHVCQTVPNDRGAKVERIEEYGYGKGFTHALSEWRNLLAGFDALRENGMAIVLLAHSAVVRFDAPDSDPYDRYQMRLHKSADALISDWADALLFANYKVTTVDAGSPGMKAKKRGVGRGDRCLHTSERPAWKAKNRYGMPDTLPMEWAELATYLNPRSSVTQSA